MKTRDVDFKIDGSSEKKNKQKHLTANHMSNESPPSRDKGKMRIEKPNLSIVDGLKFKESPPQKKGNEKAT